MAYACKREKVGRIRIDKREEGTIKGVEKWEKNAGFDDIDFRARSNRKFPETFPNLAGEGL